jgi:hypothetical protein
MEVVPSISLDEQGREVIDYDNPTVRHHGNNQHYKGYQADRSYNELTGEFGVIDTQEPTDGFYLPNDYQVQEYDPELEEYESEDFEPETDDILDELTQDDVDNEVAELLEEEPLGDDYAYEMNSYAADNYEAGHYIAATICSAMAEFHSGEISAEQAINNVLNDYDINDVVPVYLDLLNELDE